MCLLVQEKWPISKENVCNYRYIILWTSKQQVFDAEAETPMLWPLDAKSLLIGKDPDAGKDWRQKEKGMTEDEMVGWHHQLYGHEFEQAPGVSDEQGGLACCGSWGHKESATT